MNNNQGRKLIAVTPETILPLVKEYRGNLTTVARKLRVSRATILDRVNKSPELKQALFDARESLIDDVEQVFYEQVLSGTNPILMIFFLKTRAAHRGYIESKAITVQPAQDLIVNDENTMTLAKWKEMSAKNLAQIEQTMQMFDDNDDDTIDGTFTTK
jgi:hypothetical protein